MILSFKDEVYGEVRTAAWTAIEQKTRKGIVILYYTGREARSIHFPKWTMNDLDLAVSVALNLSTGVVHMKATPPKGWERE